MAQALATQGILANGINSSLVLAFSWGFVDIEKNTEFHQSYP